MYVSVNACMCPCVCMYVCMYVCTYVCMFICTYVCLRVCVPDYMYVLYCIQTVLNTAARLIARLPRYSHISYYIKEHLHWLPISTRIEYKVLLIVLKAQMGVAP